MRAGELSFQNVLDSARHNRGYAEVRSFMQVEYGIKELEASWDAFRDASEFYNEDFENENHIYDEFYNLVAEYVAEYQPCT